MSTHKNAQRVKNNAHQVHSTKARAFPKNSKSYWLSKVKKPASASGGESPHYGIQLAYKGRRMRFSLDTGEKEVAAAKAAQIWSMLTQQGWEATLNKYKPACTKAKAGATVGTLIEASARLSSVRSSSHDSYAKALRRIAAGVIGIDSGRKYDFKRGSAEWRAKVDSVSLDRLTPANVLAWKNSFLRAAKSPDAQKRAAVTINSLMRNSKALVGKKVRQFIASELELPSVLWFEGISLEAEPNLRYRSVIDAEKILQSAQKELAAENPEVFKLLLLTLVFGLRRSEADTLLWNQVDFTRSVIEIRDNEFKKLKSKDSGGEIGIEPEILALLRGYYASRTDQFVLETPEKARKQIQDHTSNSYRCDATQKALIVWLRDKGVPGPRPLHTLRKEIGSILATRDGIFKASRYLRHSDIRITSRLYADTKTPVTSGLGALFGKEAANILPFQQGDVQQTANLNTRKGTK